MLKLRRPPCFSQLSAAQRASSAAPGGPMACSASREAEAGRVSASRAGGHAPRTRERVARKSASRACFCVTSVSYLSSQRLDSRFNLRATRGRPPSRRALPCRTCCERPPQGRRLESPYVRIAVAWRRPGLICPLHRRPFASRTQHRTRASPPSRRQAVMCGPLRRLASLRAVPGQHDLDKS